MSPEPAEAEPNLQHAPFQRDQVDTTNGFPIASAVWTTATDATTGEKSRKERGGDDDGDEASRKHNNLQGLTKTPSAGLAVPVEIRQTRSRSPDNISLVSADDFSELRQLSSYPAARIASNDGERCGELAESRGWKGALKSTWTRNKGVLLVLIAQVFGTLMSVTTRMLEMGVEGGEKPLDPFQVSLIIPRPDQIAAL